MTDLIMLGDEEQNGLERLVWRVMDGNHEAYIDAHAAFAAICEQADAARRFLALTETGPDYEAAAQKLYDLKHDVIPHDYAEAAKAIVDAALTDYLTEEEM